MAVLREDLLRGRTVALGEGVRPAVRDLVVALGAAVEEIGGLSDDSEEGAAEAIRAPGPIDALVYDARTAGEPEDLLPRLEEAWRAVAAVANGALIPGASGGKIILIAPDRGAGAHAEAARSALENLARTLSIEWARYGITTTTIAPGPSAHGPDIATLVAFLVSEAGDYFSGCRFELGAA